MRTVRSIAAATLVFWIVRGAFCQPNVATAPTEFKTASVNLNTTGGARGAVRMKPEGVTGTNVTLKQLMRFAYELQDSQILGPGWIEIEGYDVVAQATGATSTASVRLMLRRLLEDRFTLKSHRETRELPVYRLVVGESGAKLRDPEDEKIFNARLAGKSPFRPGVAGMFTNKDLPGFAERLSRVIGRPVIDETGIKGNYWFQLEWIPDTEQRKTPGPSLLAAIEDQLGLKLVEHTAPTEILVIDTLGKPQR